MTDDDQRECVDLAAAALSNAVGSLMEQVVEGSGLKKQEIAQRMGITPARISQLLASDGNVRVASLARLVEAAGYEIAVVVTPKDPTRGPRIEVPRRPDRNRSAPTEPRVGTTA